jgi:hypothetical protein
MMADMKARIRKGTAAHALPQNRRTVRDAARGFLRWRPPGGHTVQHSLDADVFVELGPAHAGTAADDLEAGTLLRRGLREAPRPCQRNGDCPAVGQLHGDAVFRDGNSANAGFDIRGNTVGLSHGVVEGLRLFPWGRFTGGMPVSGLRRSGTLTGCNGLSEVSRLKTCLFRDLRQNGRSELLGVVERERIIRPAVLFQDLVRAYRAVMTPSDSLQCGKHATRLCRRPRTHAAMSNTALAESGGNSPWAIRSSTISRAAD